MYSKGSLSERSLCLFDTVKFSWVRSASGMKVNSFLQMKLKGRLFNFSQPLSLPLLLPTGSIVAFCKEAVSCILCFDCFRNYFYSKHWEHAGHSHPQERHSSLKNTIFRCPLKTRRGGWHILLNWDTVGSHHFHKVVEFRYAPWRQTLQELLR